MSDLETEDEQKREEQRVLREYIKDIQDKIEPIQNKLHKRGSRKMELDASLKEPKGLKTLAIGKPFFDSRLHH